MPKFALFIAIFFWSSAFVGIRASLEGYTPGALALFRFLVASLCMSFVFFNRKNRPPIPSRDLFLLIGVGAIGLGAYHVFLNYGEMTVSSGIASFIVAQSPLVTMLIAVLFLKEKLNFFTVLGIFVSIVGVGLISAGQSNELKFDIGLLYVLGSCIVGGLYSVLQKPFLAKYHAIDVTIYIIWGGTLSLLFFAPDLWRDMQHASCVATASAIYLGIFPAAIAYLAWSYALAAIPVSRAVSFLYFMPVIATFLGWLCLGEVPAVLSLVGGCVALLGVWIANSYKA